MAIASGPEPVTQVLPRVPFGTAEPAARRRHATADVPFAVVGSALVVAGTVTQAIAILSAVWWKSTVGGATTELSFADFGPRTWRGFAHIYFGWGAWLILGLTFGLAVAGCVHWRGARPFRVTAALAGVAASFAPIAALLVFAYQSHDDAFHVLRDYGVGPYLAVLGTMATALGAAAGSAKRR